MTDQLFRRNIGVLSESYTVYAIDLLGFGASDKPPGFAYTMETWAQVIVLQSAIHGRR
jgi:pimeloyl-ACP methyl ester carboxylesterase